MSYAAAAKGQTPKPAVAKAWKPSPDAPTFVPTASAPNPAPKSPKQKKSKKRKPTLAHMSIGDLIPKQMPQTKKNKDVKKSANDSPKKKDTVTTMPPPVDTHREGTDLMKFMFDSKVVKGKQRLRTRMKRFSPLKKKILEERLEQWKATQKVQHEARSDTVVLFSYVLAEELEDEDEKAEIMNNLTDMAESLGNVKALHIQALDNEKNPRCFVRFDSSEKAEEAEACWNGLKVAGESLRCIALPRPTDGAPDSFEAWLRWCEIQPIDMTNSAQNSQDSTVEVLVRVENGLSDEDLEDDDCLQEALDDLQSIAGRYGQIKRFEQDTTDRRQINIWYVGDVERHKLAAMELGRLMIAGNTLSARVVKTPLTGDSAIILENMLTDDDVEDPDCMEETLDDVRTLLAKFGNVVNVGPSDNYSIKVSFDENESAVKAVNGMNGVLIGGRKVRASMFDDVEENQSTPIIVLDAKDSQQARGDKIVPERFAKCISVPKVSSSGGPREYAKNLGTEQSKQLLSEILNELMRLQKRAAEENNTKAKRRLVLGLREVARGIRARKAKAVVMANNLDEYGALDEKLTEILDLAKANDVPVFYDFSKRQLGKAVGKTIKVSVICIQNVDGANQQFKKLLSIS